MSVASFHTYTSLEVDLLSELHVGMFFLCTRTTMTGGVLDVVVVVVVVEEGAEGILLTCRSLCQSQLCDCCCCCCRGGKSNSSNTVTAVAVVAAAAAT